MAKNTPRGIQATLFDYFRDTEYFTIQEANELVLEHENRNVNEESIRARIYEGVDKGLFERVGKGLYIVSRDNEDGSKSNCLLINGDGRDLSIFADNSLDAIITDHPWADEKSLKGGNRNFADYELFEYTEDDFKEKQRVLKPGHFLVEFLPEENANNYQYLYRVKEMARKAGMEYYAKVGWKKGDFVANTGRKSKNVEDVCFFTKGRARNLRPDAKKDKAEPGVQHYMSGAHGMLPPNFDFSPPGKKERIHQAEKPVALLEEILKFVTLPGETALDQFAGSGVLGEAALNTGRNSILIEKDAETFHNLTERLARLGDIQTLTSESQTLINLGTDALVALDAFNRTGDREIINDFVNTHKMPNPDDLYLGEKALQKNNDLTEEQKEDIGIAFDAIEELDGRSDRLDLSEEVSAPEPKILECSSRGDRRFSALFATVTIKGKEQSLEEWYQNSKRTADGKKAGKGKPFDHIVCPFTGAKLPAEQASNLYKGLWITYLNKNHDLVAYASTFDEFHDMFKGKNTVNCQADVIAAYVRNPDVFVDEVKRSYWYQNMLAHTASKKPSLDDKISAAVAQQKPTGNTNEQAVQLTL